MKAKELMIGDWVMMDKNYSEEDPMCTRLDYQPYQIQNGDDIDIACETNCIGDADVYQPIPLTPEILEKNDFLCEQDRWWWKDFYITLASTKALTLVCNRTIQIKYVHQLQHALRLCGIEKEIIL